MEGDWLEVYIDFYTVINVCVTKNELYIRTTHVLKNLFGFIEDSSIETWSMQTA